MRNKALSKALDSKSYNISMELEQTKPSKSTKAPIVKTKVLTRHLEGASNSLIAKELDISRPTVQRILAESEIDNIVQIGRSRAVSMIPRSLDVIDNRLDKGSETAALAILRGTQVLQNQQVVSNQLNIQANTWIQMRQAAAAEKQSDPPADQSTPKDL